MKIAGYVLAGGGSRRFGTDKARALFGGTPLVAHNAAELAGRYGEVGVVSAPGRSYEDLGLRTIFDEHPDFGPLAGLEAAMRDCSADAIAVAACDLVGLQVDWYDLLEAAFDGGAVAFRDDRWQPLVGLYSVSLLPEVERRLETGELAMHRLLDSVGVAVDPPQAFSELLSIDRPEALP